MICLLILLESYQAIKLNYNVGNEFGNNNEVVKIDTDKEKMEYDKMMKSFELTSKILDRIKDLESSGGKDEAMAFQKKWRSI